MSGERARAGLVVAAFAASLALVLVTPWCTRDRVADPGTWVRALEAHRAELGHSVVLVHPPWRNDVVDAARASPALAGLTITTAFAPHHGDAWPALMVIRERGGVALPRAIAERVDTAHAETAGNLELLPMRNLEGDRNDSDDGTDGQRDLSARLADAEVTVEKPGGAVVQCPWDPLKGRHACEGLPEWMHVGVETLPVGGRSVQCTWAHPITGGRLVVHFPGVALGAHLTLSLALTDGAADNASASPVSATLAVEGRTLTTLTKPPGARGFVVRAVAVDGAPRNVDVSVVVTTPMDGQRHTCFRLTTEAAP